MSNNQKVHVIVLNFNNSQDTLVLVNDLLMQKHVDMNIVVVDNCSTDNSYSILKQAIKQERVELIRSDTNEGYACGNNYGLRFLDSKDTNYLAILNPDIKITDELLFYNLAERYELIADVGFIAPASINNEGVVNQYCAKKSPTYFQEILSSFLIFSKLVAKKNSYNLKNATKELPVEILSGSFLFTKYKFFYNIGFFDEGTFLFCEERILYEKTLRANKKNYLIRDLNIKHFASTTIGAIYTNIEQIKIFHNSLLYYIENYLYLGRAKALLLKPFLIFTVFQMKILAILKSISRYRL